MSPVVKGEDCQQTITKQGHGVTELGTGARHGRCCKEVRGSKFPFLAQGTGPGQPVGPLVGGLDRDERRVLDLLTCIRLPCLCNAQYLCKSQQCLCYNFYHHNGSSCSHIALFFRIQSSPDWISRRDFRQSVSRAHTFLVH